MTPRQKLLRSRLLTEKGQRRVGAKLKLGDVVNWQGPHLGMAGLDLRARMVLLMNNGAITLRRPNTAPA